MKLIVVLFFTTKFTDPKYLDCGFAKQYNWTVNGGPAVFNDPDGDGMDLAGSEDGWAAIIVTTDTSCSGYTALALHEFGHLFGAGHEKPEFAGLYLFPDSHAYYIQLPLPYPSPRSNLYTRFWLGYNWGQYSDDTLNGNNNVGTIMQTALSVANYRPLTGPPLPPQNPPPLPPPGCSLATPVNVTGNLVGYCDPSVPLSHYVISWGDVCPTETTDYEVWKSQPPGSQYSYGFTTVAPISDLYLGGSDANSKVRACNQGTCTPLSSSTFFAHSGC